MDLSFAETLRVFRRFDIKTPAYYVINDLDTVKQLPQFLEEHGQYRVVSEKGETFFSKEALLQTKNFLYPSIVMETLPLCSELSLEIYIDKDCFTTLDFSREKKHICIQIFGKRIWDFQLQAICDFFSIPPNSKREFFLTVRKCVQAYEQLSFVRMKIDQMFLSKDGLFLISNACITRKDPVAAQEITLVFEEKGKDTCLIANGKDLTLALLDLAKKEGYDIQKAFDIGEGINGAFLKEAIRRSIDDTCSRIIIDLFVLRQKDLKQLSVLSSVPSDIDLRICIQAVSTYPLDKQFLGNKNITIATKVLDLF